MLLASTFCLLPSAFCYKWTSKLGWLEDIEHELDGLIGDRYGVVGQILKRSRSSNSSGSIDE
jgi:hypothetical protein